MVPSALTWRRRFITPLARPDDCWGPPAVAYIKYDKASSAAAAIEGLHETVLNNGRGPMLKAMIAEAPTRRAHSLL